MNTTITLIFEKTEENKPITDLHEETGVGFTWSIYPQTGMNGYDEAKAWRMEHYGARHIYTYDYHDTGDSIIYAIHTDGGTGYSFFKHLAEKYPQVKGIAKVENHKSGITQTWFIENGQVNHRFDDIFWTETASGFYIDYRVSAAENDLNELTAEEAERVINYHNQGSTYARVIVSVEFRSGMEVLAETEFYYTGIDEDDLYANPEYLRALTEAKKNYKDIRGKVFTILKGDDVIFVGEHNEFKKFIDDKNIFML